MSTDDANDFIPEHLAQWKKNTCEYLFASIKSPGASNGSGAVVNLTNLTSQGLGFPSTHNSQVCVGGRKSFCEKSILANLICI